MIKWIKEYFAKKKMASEQREIHRKKHLEELGIYEYNPRFQNREFQRIAEEQAHKQRISQQDTRRKDDENDFLTSMAVAAVTDSTLIGYMAGGSLGGAMLGDAMNSSDSSASESCNSSSDSSSDYSSSSSDSGSCDSGSSDY